MNDAGWIAVLEQGELWTASLRSCLRRAGFDSVPVACRLASKPEIATLDRQTPLFLCVEVRPDNVPAALTLLSAVRGLPHAAAAALVDRSADSTELAAAVLEAGACVTVSSPRAMERVAKVAISSLRLECELLTKELSSPELAFRRLPWQTEPWSVG